MPYYPKQYALRELTQLYSFTSLKVIQNHSHTEKEIDEQHKQHNKIKSKAQLKTIQKRQTQKYHKKKEKLGK